MPRDARYDTPASLAARLFDDDEAFDAPTARSVVFERAMIICVDISSREK